MTVLAGATLVVGQEGYGLGRRRPAPCQPTLVKRAEAPAKLCDVVTGAPLRRLPESSAGTCTETNDNCESFELLFNLLLMSCLSMLATKHLKCSQLTQVPFSSEHELLSLLERTKPVAIKNDLGIF